MDFVQAHLLTLITVVPLLGAGLVMLLPRDQERLIKWVSLLVSLIPLALAVVVWVNFRPAAAGFQFEERAVWFPQIGASYHLGVDGIGLAMVLLTTLLTPLALLISFSVTKNVRAYFALFLMLEMGMLGVFVTLDLILFFLFWEIGLVPMYFLINQWGSEKDEREIWGGRKIKARTYAAFKFILYTMVGSLGLLLAIQVIGLTAGTFDIVRLHTFWPTFSGSLFGLPIATIKTIGFWAFTIAFASYRKGWNPDNVTAPLITLAGDVITLPLLFLSFHIVTGIGISVQTLIFLLFIGATILSFYPFRCGMPHFRRIVRESLPVFMLCGLLSTFSGTLLGSNSEALLSYAALILILPAFLEDGGAIGGILAARFSSALHTGEISPGAVPKKVLPLFLTMHIIGFIMFPLIGIFGFVIATFFSVSASIYEMVLISLIAGELLIFIVNFLAFYLSMFSFRMGINPDNVVIPVLTSTMDFVGTICLLGIAFMLHVV